MDIEMRPLRSGEILDRTFQLYRARFVMFVGIAAISTSIEILWSVVQLFATRWLNSVHSKTALIQSFSGVSTLATWAFTFAGAALATAAINRAVTAIYDGKPTGISIAFGEIRSHWLRYIWLNTLAFFIAWSPVVLVVAGAIVATGLATRAKNATQATILSSVFGATGVMIFIVFPLCMWMTLRYSLAVPACVQEGLGVLRSLKRSVLLSKETRWRILLLLLIVALAQWIMAVALVAPVLVILGKNLAHPPIAATVYILAISFLASALTKPVYGIGLTLFYFDSRVRKEGFDVERMLEPTPESTSANAGAISPGLILE